VAVVAEQGWQAALQAADKHSQSTTFLDAGLGYSPDTGFSQAALVHLILMPCGTVLRGAGEKKGGAAGDLH